MKKIFFLAACTLTIFSAQAQTTGIDSAGQTPVKKPAEFIVLDRYFSLVYEHESGGGPGNGFSIGYMASPREKRKYYIGANFSVLSGNKSESDLDYFLEAVSINLTQRVFLGTRRKMSPFLDFNVGYRQVKNHAEIPVDLGFAGWLLGIKAYKGITDTREMNAATVYVGVGYFLNFKQGSGMFGKLGLQVTDKFELIDKDSVGNTSGGSPTGYYTYFTKPVFVTFGIGFLLWKKR